MSIFKMHQLSGSSACNKRRNFDYQVNEKKGDTYYKAVAIKRATKSIIKGSPIEEIKKEMEEAFDKIPYQEKQRKLLLDDATKRITRYINWETRPLMEAISTQVSLYGKMDVEVTPDFVTAKAEPVEDEITFKNDKKEKVTVVEKADGTLEVIKLKVGKPISQVSSMTDLGLLSMIMYGRKFYREGRLKIIASYYFLTRTDDRMSGAKPQFKDFDDKQIVSLVDYYSGEENDLDEEFRSVVEDFVNGHDEDDCDEKDCEKCVLYACCKGYTEAPVATDRQFATKASDLRLNSKQQEAVDY